MALYSSLTRCIIFKNGWKNLKQLKLLINDKESLELEKLRIQYNFNTIEEYLLNKIICEIDYGKLLSNLGIIIEYLEKASAGYVFNMSDLWKFYSTNILDLQSLQELESIFETYINQFNLMEKYTILYFDEKNYLTTYMKN